MQVGIVTFHFVNNFGGVLQAYALQRVLADACGVEAVVVDYRSWFGIFTDMVRILPVTPDAGEFKSGMQTMRHRISRLRRFRRFREQNFALTRFYGTALALRLSPPGCDKYICGSDQIWNPLLTCGFKSPYFLAFERKRENKFSYAASFGISRLPGFTHGKIKRHLAGLGSISMREGVGVRLVKELAGRSAVQLIDPVFLLTRDEWARIAVKPRVREPYILVYMMQRDMRVYGCAQKIKEQSGMQVVEISRYGFRPDFVDKCLVDVGPGEFVGLVRGAECVCTNSYHGLAFSVIFGKKFCLVPCRHFSSRLSSLLELLQITLPDGDAAVTAYDRKKTGGIIERERRRAVSYLRKNVWGRMQGSFLSGEERMGRSGGR